MSEPRFHLGAVLGATPAAEERIRRLRPDDPDSLLRELLERHQSGDWGDVDEHDKAKMEINVRHPNGWLMSSFGVDYDDKLYVITEADRSATTILTPGDY